MGKIELSTQEEIQTAIERAASIVRPENDLNTRLAAKEILEHFEWVSVDEIKKGIKQGAMGRYGIGEILTIQIIGFWIYQYIEDEF